MGEGDEAIQGFHVGEVVRLKSGGPWMTVNSKRTDMVGVQWFEWTPFGESVMKHEAFDGSALERRRPFWAFR